MTEIDRLLLFLSQFDLPCKKIDRVIEFESVENLLKQDLEQLFSKSVASKMRDCTSEQLNAYQRNLKEQGITFLTRYDEGYPSRLQGLEEQPYYLFCKGDLSLFSSPSVAIVGTRMPSNYGKIITDRFAGKLAGAGLCIVSGLAYGVDSISHQKALEVGGKTIAVLGTGLNRIYPAQYTALANEISEKGLLISEFSPNFTATKYSFPQRNRIIAGLSDGVLITEAGIKSGTIYTRDFALDYGRTVYAVPGNVTSEKSVLPNDIIKTGQGQCVTSPEDILKDFNLTEKPTRPLQLGVIEQKIVDFLQEGEKDIDEIAKNCNLEVKFLISYLTMLEISGIIRKMPGGFYSLT